MEGNNHNHFNGKRTQNRARAATADVLGSQPAAPKVSPKLKPHYEHLKELRAALMEQRQDLAKDAQEQKVAFSEHMADAGTDSYDRDFALSMLSSEQNALYEIDQAIKRIESDTYGICELTGEKIERERLQAIPWTRFSASAAHELEKQGQVRRPQLAKLGSVANAETETVVEEEEA